MEDIADALKALGQDPLLIDLKKEGYAGASNQAELIDSIRRVSERIKLFKPDFAFSYACAGMIQLELGGNPWSNVFEALGIPYAVLLYDAPFACKPFFEMTGRSPLLHVICGDKARMDWFKQFGVERALHLPLGTNPRVFGKTPPCPEPSQRIAFVGSLPEVAREPAGPPLAVKVGHAFLLLKAQEPCRPSGEIISSIARALPEEFRAELDAFMASKSFGGFMTELFAAADAKIRRDMVSAAASFGVSVFGGESWLPSLAEGAELMGKVAYGPELAKVYAGHAVNLNISAAQLEGAANQRVFDCPAAGGFLLSDYRAELEELFDPGSEIVCYKDVHELRELAGRFLKDKDARAKITAAARKRALAQHSWDVRMAKALDWLLERRAEGTP